MEVIIFCLLITGMLYLIFSAPKERSRTGNPTRWGDIKQVTGDLKIILKDKLEVARMTADSKDRMNQLPEDQRRIVFIALLVLNSRHAYYNEPCPSSAVLQHMLSIFVPQWNQRVRWEMVQTIQNFWKETYANNPAMERQIYQPEIKEAMDDLYESLLDTLYPPGRGTTV